MSKTKVSVTRVLLVSMLMAVSAEAQMTVNFSSGQGYVDGSLNGQQSWTGNAGYSVNTANETVTVPAGAFSGLRITYENTNLDAGLSSYTSTVSFSFTRNVGTFASNKTFFGVELKEESINNGFDGLRLELYRTAGGSEYFLGFASSVAGQFQGGANISEALLGLNGGSDLTSDSLQISFTITKGVDESDWSYSAALVNVTNSQVIGSLSGSGRSSSLAFFSNDVDVGMITNNISDAGVSALTVSAISAIPEPSTYAAMIGLGALALVIMRRRRR